MGIRTVAVTGGDASGKTESWDMLTPKLKQRILRVPEIATALMGTALPALGRDIDVTLDLLDKYQSVFRPTQLVAEDTWKLVASLEGKQLVWCDRGIPDMVAYDPGRWPAIEQKYGMTQQEIYSRYDYVFVLRTLARHDPERYLQVLKENPARTPRSIEEAVELDEQIYQAWKDHPGLIEIDCTRGFESLVKQLEDHLARIMGKEIEKKYLLPAMPDLRQFDQVVRIFQRQAYTIADQDFEQRIRRAEIEGGPTEHILTFKGDGTLTRDEDEVEGIQPWVFDSLWQRRLGNGIVKTRHLCRYEGVLYDIDQYELPDKGVIVEVNFSSESEAAAYVPPAWLSQARDVTNDKRFKAKNLALSGKFPQLELA